MEYPQANVSSRSPPEKLFKKLPRKHHWRKSFLNNIADSIAETLQKRNLNEYVFLQISKVFQKNFMQLPLDGVYLFRKNLSRKYVINFAKKIWLM